MINKDLNLAWAAIAPILEKFDFYEIKNIAKLAGFDIEILNTLGFDKRNWEKPNAGQLISEIETSFINFDESQKRHFLNIVVEEMLGRIDRLYAHFDDPEEKLQYHLNRLGWQLIDKKILPIELLDSTDLNELDTTTRVDLIKAATRFRDGDLSGAISSACAAVDSVTERVYRDKNLGDPNKSLSFQERCNKSFKEVGVFEAIELQLRDIDWKDSDATKFKDNLKQSLNQAAYVMQTLRSNMADVHRTKPVIRSLAFDSIKWSQIIVRLLSEKYDS
ncbi:MAG: hypothetical protein HOP02_04605 [Methylococcaceae bacterium]|nr:hypothetical protein [Methylococcaceae bacterium]